MFPCLLRPVKDDLSPTKKGRPSLANQINSQLARGSGADRAACSAWVRFDTCLT
jgi:hypothetical protein